MISSTVYGNLTYNQISNMKHAIGFDNRKVRGTKHRKYEPYRNHFVTGVDNNSSWEYLVSIGFATKSSENCYHVSDDGKLFLQYVTGVEILKDMD